MKQIVTHPYNQGNWVSLAGFIDAANDPDISEIEKRMIERKQKRQLMERKKYEEKIGNHRSQDE